MSRGSILLLEDDILLSQTIEEYLAKEGFCIYPVYDGISAQDALYEKSFDLLLLDIKVPELNGLEVLKAYRKVDEKSPAIFITSLNSLKDIENGFLSGCDDYIKKPFELKELLIRIDALLKKSFGLKVENDIKIGENTIFSIKNMSLRVNDKTVKLPEKEYKLLCLLLKKRDSLVSHEEIMSHLWNYEQEGSDESLRTHIKNLRKILGKNRIVSYKKLGYKFTA